jgi:hypothetical protein
VNAPRLTSAQISRLAGVSLPAVTNWRHRHPDFPQPDGHPTRPTFDQDEVETWLYDHGKLRPPQASTPPAGVLRRNARIQRTIVPVLQAAHRQQQGAWLPINELADCMADHANYKQLSAAADRLVAAAQIEKTTIYFGSRPVAALRIPAPNEVDHSAIQRHVNEALADIGHRVTITEAQKVARNFTEATIRHNGHKYRVYHWTNRYVITTFKINS